MRRRSLMAKPVKHFWILSFGLTCLFLGCASLHGDKSNKRIPADEGQKLRVYPTQDNAFFVEGVKGRLYPYRLEDFKKWVPQIQEARDLLVLYNTADDEENSDKKVALVEQFKETYAAYQAQGPRPLYMDPGREEFSSEKFRKTLDFILHLAAQIDPERHPELWEEVSVGKEPAERRAKPCDWSASGPCAQDCIAQMVELHESLLLFFRSPVPPKSEVTQALSRSF